MSCRKQHLESLPFSISRANAKNSSRHQSALLSKLALESMQGGASCTRNFSQQEKLHKVQHSERDAKTMHRRRSFRKVFTLEEAQQMQT